MHDELLFEVRPGRLQEAAAAIRRAMEGAGGPGFSVPLRVKLRAGPAWGSLAPLALGDGGCATPAPHAHPRPAPPPEQEQQPWQAAAPAG